MGKNKLTMLEKSLAAALCLSLCLYGPPLHADELESIKQDLKKYYRDATEQFTKIGAESHDAADGLIDWNTIKIHGESGKVRRKEKSSVSCCE